MNKGEILKQTLLILKNHSLFSCLDQSELGDLARKAKKRKFQDGDWIVHNGDIWPNLFFVQKGEVTAIKESPEGRSLTLTTIRKEEVFYSLTSRTS